MGTTRSRFAVRGSPFAAGSTSSRINRSRPRGRPFARCPQFVILRKLRARRYGVQSIGLTIERKPNPLKSLVLRV
jgi:hypothetical protein